MTTRPTTLGALRDSGWRSRSVKREIRDNLVAALREGRPIFPGLVGYDETVVPQVCNALLAGHDFILLGLRGQAKTRLLRTLPLLLDEALPVVAGSELNDDPFAPVCTTAIRLVAEKGDATPIAWLSRAERYHEKLATPDVTIADLIGDVDPIKAATRRLTFADPEVIHFGIVPRSNRGIFAINELPDLAARIQVGLLNILEEGDLQIRGFPIRLPMDLLMVFSANPEDYTNRGNIITPLRDRIASQILTHYPRTLAESAAITAQEAWLDRDGPVDVEVPELLRELVEQVAFCARASDFVDQSSGVSARVTIALIEHVVSNAERRALRTGESPSVARVGDLIAGVPALTGKIELVYEGEREGVQRVAAHVLAQAVAAVFDRHMPPAYGQAGERRRRGRDDEVPAPKNAYTPILQWFQAGHTVEVSDELPGAALFERLGAIPGLGAVTREVLKPKGEAQTAAAMEFVLEGLAAHSLLAREDLVRGRSYRDPLDQMARQL